MYYILFYSFKHDPSPCDILGEIEKLWFRGYESVSFEPFTWVQPIHATKWTRETSSISNLCMRSCTWKFYLKRTFILWPIVAQSFFPNPFLPLNIASSHLPISVASPHLGEPPNGLKQPKR